jgi:hypothetical protein
VLDAGAERAPRLRLHQAVFERRGRRPRRLLLTGLLLQAIVRLSHIT